MSSKLNPDEKQATAVSTAKKDKQPSNSNKKLKIKRIIHTLKHN